VKEIIDLCLNFCLAMLTALALLAVGFIIGFKDTTAAWERGCNTSHVYYSGQDKYECKRVK